MNEKQNNDLSCYGNLPLQLINSIQQILIDVGQVKGEVGKARAEIQSVNLHVMSMDKKIESLSGSLSMHEKSVDAHYKGEIKHDNEQHFSVVTQYCMIFLTLVNTGFSIYQITK